MLIWLKAGHNVRRKTLSCPNNRDEHTFETYPKGYGLSDKELQSVSAGSSWLCSNNTCIGDYCGDGF